MLFVYFSKRKIVYLNANAYLIFYICIRQYKKRLDVNLNRNIGKYARISFKNILCREVLRRINRKSRSRNFARISP